jgi:hypothetical protein
VFFCEPAAADWQSELYESCHRRIVSLHESHDVPYEYGEWCSMLLNCGVAAAHQSDATRGNRPPHSDAADVALTVLRW